jgi:hypothetical protein
MPALRCQWGLLLVVAVMAAMPTAPLAQAPAVLHNAAGLRLLVAEENTEPTLRILLPGSPDTDRDIEVIFPEHVTAKKAGSDDSEHLYLFQPGEHGERPDWRQVGQSLQYEREFKGGVHFLARATIEDDGVLFHYEFENHSNTAFDMIYAVTDPRLTGIFHDVRLERTYVHRSDGFGLLAAETPSRLSMPLSEWLPARYLDSFTWPVPAEKVERRADGITYYNSSQPVDEPMVATISADHKWIVSSFTRTVGNVWSNPELTCQHVDPETSLAPGGQAVLEVKILIFQGTLDQAFQKVVAQREMLK